MRKFILVDQSIKDSGGHHLEYALRILKVAKDNHFKTCLVTNKDFPDNNLPSIEKVVKGFTYTFWDNYRSEYSYLSEKTTNFIKDMQALAGSVLYAMLHKKLGQAYHLAAQGYRIKELLERHCTSISVLKYSPLTIVLGSVLFKISFKWKRLAAKNLCVERFLRLVYFVIKYIFYLIIALFFLPAAFIFWIYKFLKPGNFFDGHFKVFAREFQEVLKCLKVTGGDVIFFPTLGNVEVSGIAACLQARPVRKQDSFFLACLFRRDLFFGRESSYASQIKDKFLAIQSFNFFKTHAQNIKYGFFTDTQPLTSQYNLLGSINFKTLPIPAATENGVSYKNGAVAKKEGSRTKMLYLGDARDEKGFYLLPRLARDLLAAGYSKNEFELVLQSNFNVPEGEPKTKIAIGQLRETPDVVSLIGGPFKTAEYENLLASADTLLVPYHDESYYARSSGIFAEALALGVPVICRNKTWMSSQLLRYNLKYIDSLCENLKPLQVLAITGGCRPDKFLIYPKTKKKLAWFIFTIDQVYEATGTFVDITWEADPPVIQKKSRSEHYMSHACIDLREKRSSVLVKLPYRARYLFKISLNPDFHCQREIPTHSLGGLSLKCQEVDLPADTPLGKVGSLFARNEDFTTAAVEVLQNLECYKKSAKQFQSDWVQFHSATSIVTNLAQH